MDINECDVICFDADFTLLRYANKEFLKLQFTSLAKCLIDAGAPPELLEMVDLDQVNLTDTNGLIADFRTGYTLKLDSENTIYRAYFGLEEAHNLEHYGSPPKYTLKNLKYYEPGEHYIFLSHYAIGGATLWKCCVELIKQGKYHLENYGQLGVQFRNAVMCNYLTEDPKKSHFYPNFFSNTEIYLVKASQSLKDGLQNLKNLGKKIILVTNSFHSFANYTFEYCFGSDWHNYFDYYVYAAGKPDFFLGSDELESLENLELTGKAYQKGSSTHLKEIINSHKCAFVGDHYLADIHGSRQNNWVNVAIVQEIFFEKSINWIASVEEIENAEYCRSSDVNVIDGFSVWGSHFKDKQTGKRLFWWDFVVTHSNYIVPDIDHVFQLFSSS